MTGEAVRCSTKASRPLLGFVWTSLWLCDTMRHDPIIIILLTRIVLYTGVNGKLWERKCWFTFSFQIFSRRLSCLIVPRMPVAVWWRLYSISPLERHVLLLWPQLSIFTVVFVGFIRFVYRPLATITYQVSWRKPRPNVAPAMSQRRRRWLIAGATLGLRCRDQPLCTRCHVFVSLWCWTSDVSYRNELYGWFMNESIYGF